MNLPSTIAELKSSQFSDARIGRRSLKDEMRENLIGKLNRRGMPVRAQILGTTLSTALIAANFTRGLTELFGFMALLATVATLVLYFVAGISALRLTALGTLPRGALTAVAIAGTLYALWTLYGAGLEATGWGAVLLATGVPVYVFMRSRGGSSRAAAENPAAPPGSAA